MNPPFVDLIKKEFSKRKENNTRYSMRAFARDLKINSGTLSSVFQGKRDIPHKRMEDLLQRMAYISPEEKQSIKRSQSQYTAQLKSKAFKYEYVIDEKLFPELVLEELHMSLLALMNTKGFVSDTDWISARLKVSREKVESALARLVEASLIRVNGSSYEAVFKNHSTRDPMDPEIYKEAHKQNLERALSLIENNDPLETDLVHFKFASAPENFDLLKREIRRFQKQVMKIASIGDATEVFELSLQLFTRTQMMEDS